MSSGTGGLSLMFHGRYRELVAFLGKGRRKASGKAPKAQSRERRGMMNDAGSGAIAAAAAALQSEDACMRAGWVRRKGPMSGLMGDY